MTDKIWRTIDLINWGHQYFLSHQISNAKLEIEWLLCDILKCKRIDLYVDFEQPVMKNQLHIFKKYIKRRIKGEPFQYILGKADFYGNDFLVNHNVLIPRPETETIINLLEKKNININKILEIGTGSGCISITIFLKKLANSIIATDISKDALGVAKKNAIFYGANTIDFKMHDFLSTDIHSNYDCIVSNPPYIKKDEINNLQSEVRKHEPQIALTDQKDGMSFYRRFADIGMSILNKNGFMLLEFGGASQVGEIVNIFQKHPYKLEFHNDLQGDPRILEVKLTA